MKKTRVFLIALMAFTLIPALALAGNTTYSNEAPAFTFTYPNDWENKPLKGSDVLRVAKPGPYGIPVLNVTVADKKPDAKPLDKAGKGFMKAVQTASPDSKRFKLLSEKVMTLSDGSKAMAITFKWNLNDFTKLQSASVMVYKGKKAISLTCTTILGGETTPDKLLEMCQQIKFK
jgi:hypothetical protein